MPRSFASEVWKHVANIVALGVFFLLIVAVAINSTASGANEAELERSTRLARYAIDARISMLAASADANSYWDDAAQAVYGTGDSEAFFDANWMPPTADNPDYDAVVLFGPDNQLLYAAQDGVRINGLATAEGATAVTTLLASMQANDNNVSSLFRADGDLVLLAASHIRFTDEATNQAVIGDDYAKLVYIHRLDQQAIRVMGEDLAVAELGISPDRPQGPRSSLIGPDGKIVGYLKWAPPSSGREAVWQSLPVLVASSLLFFIALYISARLGMSLFAQLSTQAGTDALSGLPNRRALRRELAALQGRKQLFALALIDLDGFKNVNDRYGHAVGDQLIRKISQTLTALAGEDGTIARLGGDEFAVLFSGWNPGRRLELMARHFLDGMAQAIDLDGRSIWIGASIGLAEAGGDGDDPGEILRRADIAMYSAKQKGKMRLEWFAQELDAKQQADLDMAAELRAALQSGDLRVVYQPIVDSRTKALQSVEALLRWTSPTCGAVPPDRFIPVAETHGLIDGVGLFVMERACSDVATTDGLGLAVNVSSAQLRNPAFARNLGDILARTGMPPERLELEITETYLISDTDQAQSAISEILALGVSVSLDDFGTGYASIGFLRQFAFGKLKIDRSLIQEGMQDEAARALVHLSIAAARAMNMKVTAEGIETEIQAQMMTLAGCDQLQGWHCGYPVEFDDLTTSSVKVPGGHAAWAAEDGGGAGKKPVVSPASAVPGEVPAIYVGRWGQKRARY